MNRAGEAEYLRAEIRRTRADLGQTVAEIATRTDVRARMSRTLADPAVRQRLAVAAAAGLFIAIGAAVAKAGAARWRAKPPAGANGRRRADASRRRVSACRRP